jgi:hypothetical protein
MDGVIKSAFVKSGAKKGLRVLRRIKKSGCQAQFSGA